MGCTGLPVVKISILLRRQVSPKDIVETCRTIIEVEVFLSHHVEGGAWASFNATKEFGDKRLLTVIAEAN